MAVDWELEHWLLDAGERVTHKLIEVGHAALTPAERLVREVWLLDLETRNGGVSQYFCNRGLAQWKALCAAWMPDRVPSLKPIIDGIDHLINGIDDPYLAALAASSDIDELYESHQAKVKSELRRLLTVTA